MSNFDPKTLDTLPFRPESAEWLASLSKDRKSAGTIDCYARDLRCFASVMDSAWGLSPLSAGLTQVGQQMVNDIVAQWTESGSSIPTVLRRFAAIRGFARFLTASHGVDCSRLLFATLPQIERSPKRAIAEGELEALLTLPSQANWIQLRTAALITLQESTGLTTSELVALDMGQAPNSWGAIAVENTHLCPRLTCASSAAMKILDRYLGSVPFTLGENGPLFVNARNGRLSVRSVQIAFRRHAAGFGLSFRIGPMCLRHSKGRKLVADGHAAGSVSQLMGISVAAVQRYFHPEV